MKIEYPDHADTLIGVGLGAILATLGGFIANLVEARLHLGQRERTAALILGELLTSIRVMIRAIQDAHSRGDPFGPLTMRLLRSARREIDAYERNRLALTDLRDTQLRLDIHALMIRIALAIDSVLEMEGEDQRLSYEYMLTLAPDFDPLIAKLMPIAGQSLKPYDDISHDPASAAARQAAEP